MYDEANQKKKTDHIYILLNFHFLHNCHELCEVVVMKSLFLCAFTANPHRAGLKQYILQPNNPNQFVNFPSVDRHFYCKTKSERL